MNVALPLANDVLVKLSPPRLSESVTKSLKLMTTLLKRSSAMMETLARLSYVYRLTAANGGTLIVPATLGSEAGLLGAAMLPYSG